MATAKAAPSKAISAALILVWGDDEFVRRRAKEVFRTWQETYPGADEEIVDATASNSEEVLRALARLRESMQSLPFFGSTKSIWFRGCNFVGEDRVSEAEAVLEAMAGITRELAGFRWDDVRLLITAGKVDRRRGFIKTLEKIAVVEHLPGLDASEKDWRDKAETLAAAEFREQGKRVEAEALAAFVEQVGADVRQMANEAQKLTAYVGDRPQVSLADVEAVVTRGRHARAFALADSLGERNLGQALRHLDEELWSMQSDRKKSEIGLLYALLGKVRTMLLAQEMAREGLIRPGPDYGAFANRIKQLPADRFPSDKRYSPLQIHPYVLFRAAQQAANFTRDELVEAMSELLRCNRRLVGSSTEGRLVLQFALSRLIGASAGRTRAGGAPLEGRRQRA